MYHVQQKIYNTLRKMWCIYTNLYVMRSAFVCNNPLLSYICMSIGGLTFGGIHLLGSRINKANLHNNWLGFIGGELQKSTNMSHLNLYRPVV